MTGGSTLDGTAALLDAVRRHDADGAARLLGGSTLAVETLDVRIDDPDELRAMLADVFAALPDLSIRAVRTFAGEQQLAVELVLSGTMTGALRGTPATGRAAELFGRAIIDLTGDRRSVSLIFDRTTALEQLGLLAEPPRPGRNDGAGLRAALLEDRWWSAPSVAPEPAAPEPAEVRRRGRRALVAAAAVGAVGAVALAAGAAIVLIGGGHATPSAARPVAAAATSAAAVPAAPPLIVVPAPRPAQTRWRSTQLFVIGGTRLTPEADTALSTLAASIRSAGASGSVTVTAYTDDVGSVRRNVVLSAQRAAVVGATLRGDLADPGWQVRTVGAGPADPLVPNTTYANQARNRRVEVVYRPR